MKSNVDNMPCVIAFTPNEAKHILEINNFILGEIKYTSSPKKGAIDKKSFRVVKQMYNDHKVDLILSYSPWDFNSMKGGEKMYRITDACVSCGICVDECPTSSISQGSDYMVISTDTCTECGICSGACPSDAIIEE